ncbi:MAG TPA: ankyrin repeat domain-containing protein, partial [Spirochaetota bacterium]|nr:ankyrin repeat domain-containing protein [Spirochaetota bacterium]
MRLPAVIVLAAALTSCAVPGIRTFNNDLAKSYHDPVGYFHRVAGAGDLVAVMRCVEEGFVGVNARDAYGWTACMYAARGGHDGVVEYLVAKGADFKAAEAGETALTIAIDGGWPGTAAYVIEAGGAVTSRDPDGNSPLMKAAVRGYGDIVRELLSRGFDINEKNNAGKTPLLAAIEARYFDIAGILL